MKGYLFYRTFAVEFHRGLETTTRRPSAAQPGEYTTLHCARFFLADGEWQRLISCGITSRIREEGSLLSY